MTASNPLNSQVTRDIAGLLYKAALAKDPTCDIYKYGDKKFEMALQILGIAGQSQLRSDEQGYNVSANTFAHIQSICNKFTIAQQAADILKEKMGVRFEVVGDPFKLICKELTWHESNALIEKMKHQLGTDMDAKAIPHTQTVAIPSDILPLMVKGYNDSFADIKAMQAKRIADANRETQAFERKEQVAHNACANLNNSCKELGINWSVAIGSVRLTATLMDEDPGYANNRKQLEAFLKAARIDFTIREGLGMGVGGCSIKIDNKNTIQAIASNVNLPMISPLQATKKLSSKGDPEIILPHIAGALFRAALAQDKERFLQAAKTGGTAKLQAALDILKLPVSDIAYNGSNGYKVNLPSSSLQMIEQCHERETRQAVTAASNYNNASPEQQKEYRDIIKNYMSNIVVIDDKRILEKLLAPFRSLTKIRDDIISDLILQHSSKSNSKSSAVIAAESRGNLGLFLQQKTMLNEWISKTTLTGWKPAAYEKLEKIAQVSEVVESKGLKH